MTTDGKQMRVWLLLCNSVHARQTVLIYEVPVSSKFLILIINHYKFQYLQS